MQNGESAVLCALELEADADEVGGALLAQPGDSYPGEWASQRSYALDSNTMRALSAAIVSELIDGAG